MGHNKVDCPQPLKPRGGGDRACYQCGQTGSVYLKRTVSDFNGLTFVVIPSETVQRLPSRAKVVVTAVEVSASIGMYDQRSTCKHRY